MAQTLLVHLLALLHYSHGAVGSEETKRLDDIVQVKNYNAPDLKRNENL